MGTHSHEQLCNLEEATPTSGIIQVFLVPSQSGGLGKVTWKICWNLDLKKEEVLTRWGGGGQNSRQKNLQIPHLLAIEILGGILHPGMYFTPRKAII